MAAKQATTVIEPDSKGSVFVVEAVDTRYGTKYMLGGDTYDALAGPAANVSGDLDFHEHHCAFDRDLDEWTIDADDESLEALSDALEAKGFSFGGVADELVDELRHWAPEPQDHDWQRWSDLGMEVTVTYESKQSGREMTKEGVVTAVDPSRRVVVFERDDGKSNRLMGDAIYSTSSRYPYMGAVTGVELRI